MNKKDYIDFVSKKYSMNLRPIEERDYTVSDYEGKLVSDFNKELCCACCGSTIIEEIIGRPFTDCGRCYCCVGDDPSFDSPNLCIFVNESLEKYIFFDKNSPCKYYEDK